MTFEFTVKMKPRRNLDGIHNDFSGVGSGLRRGCILIRNRDGVSGMLTFLELAHMLDAATQCMLRNGWGGMLKLLDLAHMLDATQWRRENAAVPNLCKKRQWHTCARKTPEKSEAAKWQHKVLLSAGFKQKQPQKHSISKPSSNMLTSRSIAFTVEILPRILPHWK